MPASAILDRRDLLKAGAGLLGASSLAGCALGAASPRSRGESGTPAAGIRYRADGPVVLLVAHCDDAAFQCWHYLKTVRPLRVVDVFMGVPPEGTFATDARMGRYDAAAYLRTRREEEKEALARAGAEPIFLSGLDMPYRDDAPPNLGTLASELAAAVPEASLLVAPLGLGNRIRVGTRHYSHVDHKFVRDVADSFASVPKVCYAELYALSKASSDYRELLEHMRAYAHWTLNRVDFAPEEIRAKRSALECYRSQMAGLLADVPDILSDGVLGTELYWSPG